jgi:hypothetical protein
MLVFALSTFDVLRLKRSRGTLPVGNMSGGRMGDRQRWSGDGEFVLPAGFVEPYRLWFEYLKSAYADETIEVDNAHYARWGDVANLTFNQWWGKNWRTIFAVKARKVSVVDGDTKSDLDSLLLRIPLSGSTDALMKQVRSILVKHEIVDGGVVGQEQGQFKLAEGYQKGFLNNLNRTRRYLRLYQFWLKHADKDRMKRLDAAARDFHNWGEKRSAKLASQNWTKPKPYVDVPRFYKVYVVWLDAKQSSRQRQTDLLVQDRFEEGNVRDARRMIARDISRARKIAEFTGKGIFPQNSVR